MKSVNSTSRARRGTRTTRPSLQILEDRCTPAGIEYIAATKTLIVTGSNNLPLVVTYDAAVSTVLPSVAEDSSLIFPTSSSDPMVRNLIVRFDKVDHGDLTVAGWSFDGDLTVRGARLQQTFVNYSAVHGNLKYEASGESVDDLTFANIDVGGKMEVAMGGGTNTLRLQKGEIDGDLRVTGGNGDDRVELVEGDDLEVDGSATFRLGGGTNRLEGISNHNLVVGKSMNYLGDAGRDAIELAAHATGLDVAGRARFNLGDSPAALGNYANFHDVTVEEGFTVNGGDHGDIVWCYGAVVTGGRSTFALREGTNYLNISGAGYSQVDDLRYIGGAGNDAVDIDYIRVNKNARIALGGGPATQSVRIGNFNNQGVMIHGSLGISSGSSTDKIELRRLNVERNLAIRTGNGEDSVAMDKTTVMGTTSIDLGSGNDNMAVAALNSDGTGALTGESNFYGTFTVRSGSGDDQLNLSDDMVSTTAIHFYSRVKLIGGGGDDVMINTGNTFDVNGNFADFEIKAGDPLP